MLTMVFPPAEVFAYDSISASLPAGIKKAASTANLELYYDPDMYSIYVRDKRNGFVWSSCVTEEQYDMTSVNPLWQANMRALFDFKYVTFALRNTSIMPVNNINDAPRVEVQPIKNGISMTYSYDKLEISIKVNLYLDDYSFNIDIPERGIVEKGDCKIVSLEMMPFFGASSGKENGYVFYPDGSGAIYKFKEKTAKSTEKYTLYVYGTDKIDYSEINEIEVKDIKNAMLPVFGIKKGNNAFLAVITKGDYDAAVSFYPSGNSTIKLNRIAPEFTFRRTYSDIRNDPKLPPKVEKERVPGDRGVKYFFLADEQADYSGMANIYREYIIKEGKLKSSSTFLKNGVPLSLDLFMGITEKRLLFDKYITVTKFSEAKTILDEFLVTGVDNMELNLMGWTDKGYGRYPANFKANSKLGGDKGLKKLAEYTNSMGIPLYLQSNFIDATSGGGKFSKRNDVIYQKNGLVVTNYNGRFMFNPLVALNRFVKEYVPGLSKLKGVNMSFEKLGSLIYFDYNDKHPVTRKDTAEYWNKMLGSAKSASGSVAVSGGNLYVLNQADRLYDIPTEDSGYILTDEAIPFYQMVVHGYIPYSSTPGNLFYDHKLQKLKMIEYGCIPYFRLTYRKPSVLKYTDYNRLFSSYYKDWIDTAVDIYEEFNERLDGIWDQPMIDHRQLDDNVYKVTYKNGTSIYINYNTRAANAEGYTIKAQDYLVVNKGGKVR